MTQQVADLVLGGDLDGLGQVAVGHRLHGVRSAVEALADRHRDVDRRAGRDQQRDHGQDDQAGADLGEVGVGLVGGGVQLGLRQLDQFLHLGGRITTALRPSPIETAAAWASLSAMARA
jgi:hypothetical protein